jgi:hypothetical protein
MRLVRRPTDLYSATLLTRTGILEDPDVSPPDDMWTMTQSPLNAPNEPTDITVHFEKGIPVKLVTPEKTYTDSVELFVALNKLGYTHGIGRIDIVENRFIGLKSRGCYDSPAMTVLRLAHLDLEGLVMDTQVRNLRDQFVSHNWSYQLYNGMYFSPEREFIENSLLFSQRRVNGEVRLKLYKGNAYVLGRSSATEKLYSEEEASMDTLDNFSPMDTTGFIAIQSIRYVYTIRQSPRGVTNDIQAQEVRSSEGRGGRQLEPRLSLLSTPCCGATGLERPQINLKAENADWSLSSRCINEIMLNMSAAAVCGFSHMCQTDPFYGASSCSTRRYMLHNTPAQTPNRIQHQIEHLPYNTSFSIPSSTSLISPSLSTTSSTSRVHVGTVTRSLCNRESLGFLFFRGGLTPSPSPPPSSRSDTNPVSSIFRGSGSTCTCTGGTAVSSALFLLRVRLRVRRGRAGDELTVGEVPAWKSTRVTGIRTPQMCFPLMGARGAFSEAPTAAEVAEVEGVGGLAGVRGISMGLEMGFAAVEDLDFGFLGWDWGGG